MNFVGKYPAVVKSYSQATRECRVEIPGITDGGNVLPNAEICYPIGDKSVHGSYATEIEILPGDKVWVEFLAGDPRYPIIVGYRNPTIGDSANWRRIHHKNIEQLGDEKIRIAVGQSQLVLTPDSILIEIGGSKIELNSSSISEVSAAIGLTGALTNTSSSQANFKGGLNSSEHIVSKGIVLATHTHSDTQPGSGSTGQPQ